MITDQLNYTPPTQLHSTITTQGCALVVPGRLPASAYGQQEKRDCLFEI